MQEQFTRTAMLLGEEAIDTLARATVAVFGIGGVGSFVAEGLARCGVGHLVLIDNDVIDVTNVNRQLPATLATVGRLKTEVMRERILAINPQAEVECINAFYLPELADRFFAGRYDYLVDAVDTVTAKVDLALQAEQRGIPLISSMGTGNKLDPTAFRVADIYATKACPLARVMRRELKARGVKKLKVVYSEEPPIKIRTNGEVGKATPGSVSFVPSVAGLIIAGEVVKDLIGYRA